MNRYLKLIGASLGIIFYLPAIADVYTTLYVPDAAFRTVTYYFDAILESGSPNQNNTLEAFVLKNGTYFYHDTITEDGTCALYPYIPTSNNIAGAIDVFDISLSDSDSQLNVGHSVIIIGLQHASFTQMNIGPLLAGRVNYASVSAINDGEGPWVPGGVTAVTASLSFTWGSDLAQWTNPSQIATFNFEIHAPTTAGTYSFGGDIYNPWTNAAISNYMTVPVTVIAPAADNDGDGMPNEWEVLHGTNPLVADSAADPDGDGLSNYAEYLGGTHPLVFNANLSTRLEIFSPSL